MTPTDRAMYLFAARINIDAVSVLPRSMVDSPVYRHMVAEGFA